MVTIILLNRLHLLDVSGYEYSIANHILFIALQSNENKWILKTESKWVDSFERYITHFEFIYLNLLYKKCNATLTISWKNCTQKRLPRRLVVRCPISQKLGYTR